MLVLISNRLQSLKVEHFSTRASFLVGLKKMAPPMVHTLWTLSCLVSCRYLRMLHLCWVRYSCNENGHFFSFNTQRFCSILNLVLCLMNHMIIGRELMLFFLIRWDLLMSLMVISRWSLFLSSPHVVGRAYCSYSVSFLPSVSTIYQVSIGFIWRN